MSYSSAVALLLATGVLAACHPKDAASANAADSGTAASAAASAPTSPNVVTITAKEYAFIAPDSIPAGLTTIHFLNSGHELHHVQFIKLAEGKTAQDFAQAIKSPGAPPTWLKNAGGVNPPAPGGEASATLDFTPGNYVIACFVFSADQVPHVAKGMWKAITVTPATGPSAPEPKADVAVRMTDYTYAFSTPITSGTHTLRIENDGPQPHEFFIARLVPGKTAQDLVAWVFKQQGPPPAEPMGGVSAIEPGEHAFVTEEFRPGNYAILCFEPDAKDGKPHVMHGMVQQIKVGA